MDFNLPIYSEFYKFFLVDELALCKNPALIHYGKCSVIGHLSICGNFVSSLTIQNVEKCFQVPDSSFSVKLNIDFFPSKFLNSTVEIFGEVRLYDSTSEKCDIELESAHSLIEKLRKYQMNLESSRGLPARPPSGTNDASLNYAVKGKLQNEIVGFRLRYKPVIQVSSIRHISEAKEVIVENLRWRQLQSVRKRRLKLR